MSEGEKWIVAINVKIEGKLVMMGAVWTGEHLRTVRAKAAVYPSKDEAEGQRFYVACKYPLMMERLEIMKLDDGEYRYQLKGGEEIKTE